MASHFGWVDFAEEDRQQMLDVIRLFREQDTRDELGIGSIRDAFSEYLFPGTSTIQTRARYMLFVPWIYLSLEGNKTPASDMAHRARHREIRLINALRKTGATEGLIGRDAGKNLKRMPSTIYWNGLGSWTIRLFPGSHSDYHRHVSSFYRQQRDTPLAEDGEPVLVDQNWDPAIPPPPEGFLTETTFQLAHDEALYLQSKVCARHPHSLLAKLLMVDSPPDTTYPWEQTGHNKLIQGDLAICLTHADFFSDVIYGAVLLYNLLVAREAQLTQLVDDYEHSLTTWSAALQGRQPAFTQWSGRLREFWHSQALRTARVPPGTRVFVERWVDLVAKDPRNLHTDTTAHRLIRDRECALKGSRARMINANARRTWSGGSGVYRLDYRWRVAQTMVRDIHDGLRPAKTSTMAAQAET